MIFNVTNGKGLIKIGLSEEGSYFMYEKPTAVVWYDRQGSIAKLLSILPYNKKYKQEIAERINHSLYEDFTDREHDAYKLIEPLLELFENGKYALIFSTSENKNFFKYCDSANINDVKYNNWDLEITSETDKLKSQDMIFRHKKVILKNSVTKEFGDPSLLEFSTHCFYDGSYLALIATQPLESINIERVKFYEQEIKQGKRPFAITINKYVEIRSKRDNGIIDDDSLESAEFVIDGHHKLMAYQKLQIHPPILSIGCIPENVNEFEFDLPLLKEHLFEWQVDHLTGKEERKIVANKVLPKKEPPGFLLNIWNKMIRKSSIKL